MIEHRSGGVIELRSATQITGYAAVTGVRSSPIPIKGGGSFTEIIASGTFTRALARRPEVVGLIEHDPRREFASTKAGTLELSNQTKGLRFAARLPATGFGPKVAKAIESGELTGCSFAFRVPKGGDKWTSERVGGAPVVLRTLNDLELRDITLTRWPCYPETEVALRSLESWTRTRQRSGKSVQKAILELLATRKP